MSKILNIQQTADYLGYTTRTIYTLIRTDRLRAVKVGGQWRVRVEDIEHLFAPQNIERGDS